MVGQPSRIPVHHEGRRGDEEIRVQGDIKVLLVEDDADARMSVADILERMEPSWRVTQAASAEDARSLVEAHHFDLVIADHHLPGATGLDLLRAVRRASPRTPLVLFTGSGDVRIMAQAVNDVHVDLYLAKPFDPETSISQMRALIEKRGQSEEPFRGALR